MLLSSSPKAVGLDRSTVSMERDLLTVQNQTTSVRDLKTAWEKPCPCGGPK